ncbi:FAD-dependent oxidoreductase [Rhizobium sp. ARZ01]|uniref:NAD(P)/FAD-dependent oxidoreductase n=1 Tax=Rhizobium sp. ARZ01 TaxID=2769313 RepID=UPI0032B14C58
MNSIPAKNVDVLIIGAGIGGALMAVSLLGRGLKILVVDRREPLRGSCLASTAMILHEIDVPLHRLASRIGKEQARRVWQRSARAVESLATLVDLLGVKCQLQRKKALYLAGDAYGSRALKSEAAAREQAGVTAQFLTAAQLRDRFAIERMAAIESNVSASANPAQLTAGLWRKAQTDGVFIVRGTEITDIRSVGGSTLAATSKGEILEARSVVFCTGLSFSMRLPIKGIASSQPGHLQRGHIIRGRVG